MRSTRYKELEVEDKKFIYNDLSMSLISMKSSSEKLDSKKMKSILGAPCIETKVNNTEPHRDINRITLCVSNNCNLRCKYCYAQGGDYGAVRSLMTIDTAKSFISFCKSNFDSINKIVFFGGEPLLNEKVIDFVCKEITNMYRGEKLKTPKFCIVTNGTILNPVLLGVIRKYISSITVSIDGPETIHNFNRIRANGKGSYSSVVNFIAEIKKIKTIELSYEATFTQKAIKEGFDHMKLKQYLKSSFGISGAIVNDSHLDKGYALSYIDSITREQMRESEFRCLPTEFWNILEHLIKKNNNLFCNVGFNNISVSVNGEIYGCHLLNEKSNCSLGNIAGANLYTDMQKFKYAISHVNKENQDCVNCWCRNLCGGCTVECFYDEKKGCFTNRPQKEFCEFRQEYIKKILTLLVVIRTDEPLWRLLINSLKGKEL